MVFALLFWAIQKRKRFLFSAWEVFDPSLAGLFMQWSLLGRGKQNPGIFTSPTLPRVCVYAAIPDRRSSWVEKDRSMAQFRGAIMGEKKGRKGRVRSALPRSTREEEKEEKEERSGLEEKVEACTLS